MSSVEKLLFIALSVFILNGLSYATDTNNVSVTATVISRGYCWFNTSTSSLNFGNLDPSNPVDVSVNTQIGFRCFRFFFRPVTFYIEDDHGLYETPLLNEPRMRHITFPDEFLPYAFTLDPRSGTVAGNPFVLHPLTITGTVRGADYQNAVVGSYSDTVTISIVP